MRCGVVVSLRSTTTLSHLFRNNFAVASAIQEYVSQFGEGRVWIVQVPARICIAADHTDYWKGFTSELITMASDSQLMTAVIGPRDDNEIHCQSTSAEFESWSDSLLNDQAVGDNWLDWLNSRPTPQHNWSNYVLGPVKYCQMYEKVVNGFNLLVSSTIPPSSGASSSSALTICSLIATRLSNQLNLEKEKLAITASKAEWFCGTRGGMMDHATMVFADEGSVCKLTFNPFSHSIIPLSSELLDANFSTIFTHPSSKGGEIKKKFNELAFIAREIVTRIVGDFDINDWEEKLAQLPKTMSRQDIFELWPEESKIFVKQYPLLFTDEFDIRIAERFEFAMNELDRSKQIQNLLYSSNSTIGEIGKLMDLSWIDAGQLYGIRTEIMDEIHSNLRSIDGVHGIKVMGAGFGGNLLVLHDSNVDFDGFKIVKNKPGNSLKFLSIESKFPTNPPNSPIAAVLLCGGKGSRMLEGGIKTHKPLLMLNGIPSTIRVINQLRDSQLNFDQVIVVIPPERKEEYELALSGKKVDIVIQENALGTGDAVNSAMEYLGGSIEHVYVTFGTQPLVKNSTIEISLATHMEQGAGFTLPTTWRKDPYAPLVRDDYGNVIGSLETHLDGAKMPEFGETNVGGYWVSITALQKVIGGLYTKLFDVTTQSYKTQSGELGYPNEMTNGCLERGIPVLGVPIADEEEVIGLKTPEHITLIENYLGQKLRY